MAKKKTTVIKDLGDSKTAKELVDTLIIPSVRAEIRMELDKFLENQNKRARKAAEKCPDAKDVLQEFFPKAFKNDYRDITSELDFRTYFCEDNEHYFLKIYWKGVHIISMYSPELKQIIFSDFQSSFPSHKFKFEPWGDYFKVSVKEE